MNTADGASQFLDRPVGGVFGAASGEASQHLFGFRGAQA
jgi:hypothetical protein